MVAWDIGSRHDHSVGIVLDVTEEVFDVACYVRLRGDYPQIQRAIEDLHRAFARASFTVIESNSIGAAVADNVDIPVHPRIKAYMRYAVGTGPIDFTLSSGPYYTFHVEFLNAWVPSELQRFIDQCVKTGRKHVVLSAPLSPDPAVGLSEVPGTTLTDAPLQLVPDDGTTALP